MDLHLTNPIARDLWWVASSPPLLRSVARFPQFNDDQHADRREAIRHAVEALDVLSLEEAAAAVGVRGWRVGYYFEVLVAYWITHMPGWTLLATNHQVREERRTLGAFDVIARDPNGEVEHWEVAVKFYLLLGDRADWRSWIGPNQRDRLDKKVNRMRDHQLVLSRREIGLASLAPLGVDHIHRRLAVLKGCFFTEWGEPAAGPDQSVSDAQGRWVDTPRLAALREAFPESRWTPRPKPYWLAPLHQDSPPGTLPETVTRPEMWSRLDLTPHGWSEAERWFVVPERWRDRR